MILQLINIIDPPLMMAQSSAFAHPYEGGPLEYIAD